MFDSLKNLTISKFAAGLRRKDFRAVEITRAYLDNIAAKDKKIGAYLSVCEEDALKRAEEADARLKKGEDLPPLAGAPLALKDNILLAGQPATAASKILEKYRASYDAGVVRKLKEQAAVFLGKTNLDEFAMGSSTENSGLQLTHNPHDLERVPGGSSGGSAAAVAADMALAALGSDTFGSIRQPAAFCGVVGLKTTYGSVSRSGLIAMASSMDQIGPIARSVEDAAILFKAIAGQDALDATSAPTDYGDLLDWKEKKIKGLKLGVPEEYFIPGISKEVREAVDSAVDALRQMGFSVESVSLPHTKYAVPAYYLSMPAEVSSNLARFDGIRYAGVFEPGELPAKLKDIYLQTRGQGFGPEAKRRIILGTYVLSAGYYDSYYKKAQQVRRLIARDFARAFEKVDVLLTPATPNTAFKIGEKVDDPLSMYLEDIFTGPVNLAGLPALSLPTGFAKNLPVGFQMVGKHFAEAEILGLGRLYEKEKAGAA